MKSTYLYLFVFLLIISQEAQSQLEYSSSQEHIDSLKKVLTHEELVDTNRLKLMYNYGTAATLFRISYWDSVLALSDEILHTYTDPITIRETKLLKAKTLNNIGYQLTGQGRSREAIEYCSQAMGIAVEIGDKYILGASMNNIAYANNSMGNIDKAVAYYGEVLLLMEELNELGGMCAALNNLGSIYDNQGEEEKALEYYSRAIPILEEMNFQYGLAIITENIGSLYLEQEKYDLALEYFEQALAIQRELGDQQNKSKTLGMIAKTYVSIGDKDMALQMFEEAAAIQEEIQSLADLSFSLSGIAGIYLDKEAIEEAKSTAKRAMKIAKELENKKAIRTAAKVLTQIHEKEGNALEALEMYKLSIAMRDSIQNEDAVRATAKQQAKYEYEKQKAIDDAENEALLSIEKEKKEKQMLLTGVITLVLVLVSVFLFFMFSRLKVTRRQKQIIESQKDKVEKQRDIIEVSHKEIKDSILYAKRIQSAILPPLRVVKAQLADSFIVYVPKDVVAGDFYWFRVQDNKRLFAVADCTGHGVPGAMVSVVCNNALNRSVREYGLTEPAAILNKTREIVVSEFEKSDEEVKDGMDIALCALDGNILEYAGAYNPLYLIRNGKLEETKGDRWPIGMSRSTKPYTAHKLEVEEGDMIYIFSDGLVDQFGGENGKKFKRENLKKLLLDIHTLNMKEQQAAILKRFNSWKGELEQVDDVCIIGLRIS